MFVAPVTLGDDAYTGAGSVITDDVPPGALGIARAAADQHRGLRGAANPQIAADGTPRSDRRPSYTPA